MGESLSDYLSVSYPLSCLLQLRGMGYGSIQFISINK